MDNFKENIRIYQQPMTNTPKINSLKLEGFTDSDNIVYCSITGTTIYCKGHEGYYIFSAPEKDYFLCSLAYRMFDQVIIEFKSGLCMVPKAAHERASWIFVGDPEAGLIGGGFLEKGMRYQDEKFRKKQKAFIQAATEITSSF